MQPESPKERAIEWLEVEMKQMSPHIEELSNHLVTGEFKGMYRAIIKIEKELAAMKQTISKVSPGLGKVRRWK
jgi:hypothetical protein